MGDSLRQKPGSRTLSCGANSSQNNTSPQKAQDFSPRADLEAQVTATPSPVSLAKDTWSSLESKGWLLNSQNNMAAKLSNILLSATLSFKLPADASTAICAVAFLLRDHTDESLTATITDHVINKVIDKISDPLIKLNHSIDATTSFLDATSQKQADELLSLQDAVKQQAELIKSLTETQTLNPRGLPEASWPLLSASNPNSGVQTPPGPAPPRINTITDPKVVQRVSLASKQLLIDYGPLDEGEELRPKTIDEWRELRQLFNDWVDAIAAAEVGEGQPPPALSHTIRNISVFDRSSLLLEFDSA